MYPGLLVLTPDFASSILNYRSKNLGAAMQNAKQYNRTGALYPWTGYLPPKIPLTVVRASVTVPASAPVSNTNTTSTTTSPSLNGNTSSLPATQLGSLTTAIL